MRRRDSLLLLLLPAVADKWRTELGLDATPHAQRQAATWLADLDGAINFDMETLALDHALRRSQTSQSGWVDRDQGSAAGSAVHVRTKRSVPRRASGGRCGRGSN